MKHFSFIKNFAVPFRLRRLPPVFWFAILSCCILIVGLFLAPSENSSSSSSHAAGNFQPKKLHDCEAVPLNSKEKCWDDLLSYTLEEGGLESAFDLFVDLYETEPDLPKGCHGWGHALGAAAYDLYAKGESSEFRPETSYCGYGFYHGFLERFIGERGGVVGARDFCISVAKKGGLQGEGIFKNCIHGIGHGSAAALAEDSSRLNGDLQKAVDLGASTCRLVTTKSEEQRDCFDGVFNELVVDVFRNENGFSRERYISEKAPLAFCHRQIDELKTSCYFEFMGILGHVFEGNFTVAVAFVARDIQNDEYAAVAVKKAAADFMQNDIVNTDYSPNVEACRSLREKLVEPCIRGIEVGFLAHGKPKQEWERGFAFCSSALLREDERPVCYDSMLYHFRSTYDTSLFRKICRFVPLQFREHQCDDAL